VVFSTKLYLLGYSLNPDLSLVDNLGELISYIDSIDRGIPLINIIYRYIPMIHVKSSPSDVLRLE
jgi:hypothetical protein